MLLLIYMDLCRVRAHTCLSMLILQCALSKIPSVHLVQHFDFFTSWFLGWKPYYFTTLCGWSKISNIDILYNLTKSVCLHNIPQSFKRVFSLAFNKIKVSSGSVLLVIPYLLIWFLLSDSDMPEVTFYGCSPEAHMCLSCSIGKPKSTATSNDILLILGFCI